MAGLLVNSTADETALDFDIANGVLGANFTSRLNMNLREAKGWSYGVRSFAMSARGQRTWVISAPVDIQYTTESILELQREIAEFIAVQPATEEEVDRVRVNRVRSLPGRYETAGAVLGAVSGIVNYGWPDDHVVREQVRTEEMSVDQVRAAAANFMDANALTWVIVGDLSKIEQPIRDLALGEVSVIDADGLRLR
jgi:zinc protease